MEQIHTKIAGFSGFIRRQDGAVTVDWVVLTGAIVMLGMAAAFTVGANVPGLADQVSDTMVSMDPGS